MAHDREVAGIRCMEVLDQLADFVDGELGEAEVARVRAHLEGCDWCEQFGGRYSGLVQRLRQLGDDEDGELASAAQALAARFAESE